MEDNEFNELVDEREALEANIDKLISFINNNSFEVLREMVGLDHIILLLNQLKAMETYYDILGERMDILEGKINVKK